MTISLVKDAGEPLAYQVMSEVTFASCYVYSPTGSDAASARSRRLCGLLKVADGRLIDRCARRVREQVASGAALAGYLGPQDVLIPVPASLPPHGPWVAERVAQALLGQGLGNTVWRGLRHGGRVARASTSAPGRRPAVSELFDSFAVEGPGKAEPDCGRGRLVLVDDVVTRGRTLLAAAARLRVSFPQARISGFALVRTMSFVPEVRRFLDPCVGEIQWRAGDARRCP